MDNSEELYITDLISVEMLQELQDAFSEMTGMAAITTDRYGTPVTTGSNFSDFCNKYTRSSVLGNSRCMRCDKTGAELTMSSNRPCYYYCHAGLVDFAAPIMANGKMVGSFIGGQILTSPPNLEVFEKTAIELGIDPEEYKEAVSKVSIVDDETVSKSAGFLYTVAKCLSHLAYQGYILHKNNIEIEKVSNLKSDFLANMSHEIRTPMNAVLGMIELTLREEMSDAARDYMYQIRSSAKNLLVIINDILDFSKIESGKLSILDVVYEPLSIVNDLAGIANSKIGNKPIEFTMNVAPDMPKTLYGDDVRIHQILINLITNAVKFTQQGEVHLDFDYAIDEEHDDMVILKVAVSDTGIGIKERDFHKLFNSFQQVDSKRNRNIEGTGLGLVICKQLLELMNGKINVQSVYGKGSTFSFELPQKVIENSPAIPKLKDNVSVGILISDNYSKAQLIRDLERIGAKPIILSDIQNLDDLRCEHIIISSDFYTESFQDFLSTHKDINCIVVTAFGAVNDNNYPNARIIHKPVYSLNLYNSMGISDINIHTEFEDTNIFTFIAPEANVLIIDDNSINLKVAKGLIEPIKMNVETAESAAQAIEMVSQKQYDILFMDHMMPEVDGIEATHIIRRMLPSYKDTPIIALTANAVSGVREKFIKEGMTDFVAKPIEIRDIVTKIRKWLPQEKIKIIDKDNTSNENSSKTQISLDIKELNTKEAIKMLGSEKLYLNVLEEYYNNIDDKSQRILQYKSEKKWKDYTIEVHALKSTSRQIGAEELGALAAELEKAGNNNNISLIMEKTDFMINEYIKYKDIIAPILNKTEKVTEENSYSLPELLNSMSDVLDGFDILEAEELLEKIKNCNIPENQKTYMDKLTEFLENSDIDNCHEILKEWNQKVHMSETLDMLNTLKQALNDFDILQIEEAAESLSKYNYPEPQIKLLKQIQDCIPESDIDGCIEAVEKWCNILNE